MTYKVFPRNSQGWRDHKACTLGVSITSPNWQGPKFASILGWANQHFETIRIDVTDALYRHNFMAEGAAPDTALQRANALGALWLAHHQDILDASPVKPIIIRWAEWYGHPGFPETLAAFQRAHAVNQVLRDAVAADVADFYRRQGKTPSLEELQHSTNYLIEELAVITLQARELSSAKIYPGDELQCLNVVRHGLVTEAPKGLEREHFTKVKFKKANGAPDQSHRLKIA